MIKLMCIEMVLSMTLIFTLPLEYSSPYTFDKILPTLMAQLEVIFSECTQQFFFSDSI